MSRRLRDDEPDPDCDVPGSAKETQLKNLPAWFAAVGIGPDDWGEFISDALAYSGMKWRHGPKLGKLSCRQAGLVLMALAERARATRTVPRGNR